MQVLESFDFDKRPSRSRYAKAVRFLIQGHDDDGNPVGAIVLRRGEDFPAEIKLDSVQGSISQLIRSEGKKARTYRDSDDVIVVGLDDRPARGTSTRRSRRQTTPV